MSYGFPRHGMQWDLSPHHCTPYLDIFISCGVFMHQLGGGTYRVRFQPWWWILFFLKWHLVWGCEGYCFGLTSCLGCLGWWYGHSLRLQIWRCLVPIFLLFRYFGLSFSCLKFGFYAIFLWKMSASFLNALSFSALTGTNGGAGDGFFSALINYAAARMAALAE